MTTIDLHFPVPRRRAHWWEVNRLRRVLARFAERVGPSPGAAGPPPSAVPDVAAADLTALMTEHADAAYRVALSVTRDPDLAQDVTQDALLKAWQALPTFRGDAPLRNWVLRITHNTAVSTLRRRREIIQDPQTLPETPNPRSVERQAHGRLAYDALEAALEQLDPLSRSIVVLREIEGFTYEEIAELAGVPLPTVKTRLLRARRQLALALEGWRAE